MKSKNNEQNSIIFQISEIVGKMSNQVNFLIRKNLLMSQLDVDIMMENTRELYDAICSVRCNMDVDAIPMEIENDDESALTHDAQQQTKSEDEEIIKEIQPERQDDEEIFEQNNELEMPDVDDIEYADNDDSGIRTYIKTNVEEPHTIGERLEQKEDNSLAARLQRKPVTDLMAAIGINDKFVLLNELFNGSMEKFNKSIRTLNSFSTLFGARTYMSELQIELQWDCDSEAYKKLSDLIERRFM